MHHGGVDNGTTVVYASSHGPRWFRQGGKMEGAREFPKMILRMPLDVKERLQRSAKVSLRSMNSEIVGRLIRTLDEDDAQKNEQQK
jgi:hypothetical protein